MFSYIICKCRVCVPTFRSSALPCIMSGKLEPSYTLIYLFLMCHIDQLLLSTHHRIVLLLLPKTNTTQHDITHNITHNISTLSVHISLTNFTLHYNQNFNYISKLVSLEATAHQSLFFLSELKILHEHLTLVMRDRDYAYCTRENVRQQSQGDVIQDTF